MCGAGVHLSMFFCTLVPEENMLDSFSCHLIASSYLLIVQNDINENRLFISQVSEINKINLEALVFPSIVSMPFVAMEKL